MDESLLLDTLNPPQREAVTAAPGPLLVLAGAGSGKTRVLVHRIAWLMHHEGVSPHGVLAVTFTNKAAAEMRARIEALLDMPTRGMWVGTFHSLAHRLLRMHWNDANLPENFQIIDSDDQQRLLKRIIRSMELDEDRWQARQAQWYINGKKDEGLRPKNINPGNDYFNQTMLRIYQAYDDACDNGGLVDFAELLLRAHELWLQHPEVLNHYRDRFQHILVDEFQDTNTIQYAWLRMLAGETGHLMVVGDDDQSIYGWRGAKIENIQRFEKDFKNATRICLEQNYRSTGNILSAANALIKQNDSRLGDKNLWTADGEGEPISVYAAFNEYDEANYIVSVIQKWQQNGGRFADTALLYRSNAQSRVFEEVLMEKNIPYRVYGGMRFFERAEIKDCLAYLRLIVNQGDDAAFERIINTPVRGIGPRTLNYIREQAREKQFSLWQATLAASNEKSLPARALTALENFLQLIQMLADNIAKLPLSEQVEYVIQHVALKAHYSKEKGERAQARIENLDELVSAARQFTPETNEADLPVLPAFLASAALESSKEDGDTNTDSVQLMTMHSAKGLEFPLVFLCGMEEGLFPHAMSADDPRRLEEERRLCYVGMTRAMQRLVLCYAEKRRLHGREQYHRASRFITEIPSDFLDEVRMRTRIRTPLTSNTVTTTRARILGDVSNQSGFQIGQQVRHNKFGEGVVLDYEGSGDNTRVQVQFAAHGTKWLKANIAKLEAA